LEALRGKGLEVLLLTDRVDEMWVESVREYAGKPLRSVAGGEIDLDSTEDGGPDTEPEREQQQQDFAPMLAWLAGILADDVKEVRLSTRLIASPACLVADPHDLPPGLRSMYRASGQDLPPAKRILEVNPGHRLITGLRDAQATRGEDPALADTAFLIHGIALLAEGAELGDPARFTHLVADRVASTLE
jgi:molecular chaperone HtpG